MTDRDKDFISEVNKWDKRFDTTAKTYDELIRADTPLASLLGYDPDAYCDEEKETMSRNLFTSRVHNFVSSLDKNMDKYWGNDNPEVDSIIRKEDHGSVIISQNGKDRENFLLWGHTDRNDDASIRIKLNRGFDLEGSTY